MVTCFTLPSEFQAIDLLSRSGCFLWCTELLYIVARIVYCTY